MSDIELRSGQSAPVIVVAGDVTIDWNLAASSSDAPAALVWNREYRTTINFQLGGALLLARLIRHVIGGDIRGIPESAESPVASGKPSPAVEGRHPQSIAVWAPHERSRESRETAWRVRAFQGFDNRVGDNPASEEWSRVSDDPEEAMVAVLDDAALGFRENEALWPRAVARPGSSAPWVVLKTAWPVLQGKLTDHLLDHFSDRLIVITTVEDIRRSEVHISRGLSWEASAQDLAWELTFNPKINKISRAACAIVSFGPAGAWISRRELSSPAAGELAAPRESRLVFDHGVIEGMWEENHPGGIIGCTTCLTAGVAKAVAKSIDRPDLIDGVQSGVVAMQALHETGFVSSLDGSSIAFPFDDVKTALENGRHRLAVAEVPLPTRSFAVAGSSFRDSERVGGWSILHDRYTTSTNLLSVAESIVRRGAESVLSDVPLGKFGGLQTADRQEIEGFRSIRNLIEEYCSIPRQTRPLSIAVFGPPGSGKSFGVTEVAKSLRPGEIRKITFNLSQFESPRGLVDALHQVRDIGLSGSIPLVFWDEFDTKLDDSPYGWLSRFLSLMQDGEFQDNQITHPIGRAIFVFAGGTAPRLRDLGVKLSTDEWRSVKGPDFISRLQGYVDIVGPDRRADRPDPQYVIRRATILRSILERNVPQISVAKTDGTVELAIDTGLLRAFLGVWEYKHGVRSMESIVAMSQLAGKTSYQRSSLPSDEQLRLHVNEREFHDLLVEQFEFEGKQLEKLARANHEIYCAGQRGKEHPPPLARLTYDQLEEQDRESNRAAVRGIPYKLASIGYIYGPTSDLGSDTNIEIPDEQVEALGRAEHDRWIVKKIDEGYTFGLERTDEGEIKTHPDLVPWEAMTESELAEHYPPPIRSKLGPGPLKNNADRDMIKKIPEILAKAGISIRPS
jgi:hypothetical protein